ncbi:MAG: hypothetical protein ACC619_09280, partial [Paracoccaceae bacterium]
DVLSSIRRLVSEDVSEVDENPTPADERFVLTPALRVPDTAQTPAENTENAPAPAPENEQEPAVGAAPAPAKSPAAPLGDEITARPQDDDAPAPPISGAQVASSLESRIAELEEAVGQSRDEWEPDGSEPDAGKMPERHLFQVVDNSQPGAVVDDSEAHPQAPETGDTPPGTVFFRASGTRAAPLVLGDEVSVTPPPVAETAAGSDLDEVITADDEALSQPAEPSGDDEYLDEDALRAVVALIVQEELRGRLGETLTRNMRRMVRREIQRAIALKDAE